MKRSSTGCTRSPSALRAYPSTRRACPSWTHLHSSLAQTSASSNQRHFGARRAARRHCPHAKRSHSARCSGRSPSSALSAKIARGDSSPAAVGRDAARYATLTTRRIPCSYTWSSLGSSTVTSSKSMVSSPWSTCREAAPATWRATSRKCSGASSATSS